MLRTTLLLAIILSPFTLLADNWPQWRGPDGDGVSHEKNLPTTWSEQQGVVWKCALPEWGCSTPAIWDDAVFVTTHVDNRDLVLLRIDQTSGKIVWQKTVGTGEANYVKVLAKSGDARRHQKFHGDHNLASPSPVTDGKTVVVHFGNGELAAYDFAGKQLWHRNLQTDFGPYTIWWGHANSPVLYQNLVISVCMQDSCSDLPGDPSPSYVVAHDKQSGRQVWKQPRPAAVTSEPCDSYITPIFRRVGERTEMVVMGGLVLDAYEPLSGKRLWYLPKLSGNRTITGPVAAGDMIYITQGMRQPMLAVRPKGDGERSKDEVVWKLEKGTPDSPTPVVWEGRLYYVSNDGIARCIDAKTGRQLWQERLKGDYRASPLAADGRVYFLNTKGLCTVVAAGPQFDRLAENVLDDQTFASPAVSAGRLFIRGKKSLYCIGK